MDNQIHKVYEAVGADAVIASAPDEEKYFRRHGVTYER